MDKPNKKIKLLLNEYLNNKINIKKLKDDINKLVDYKGKENYEYLNNLLYPEKSIGCRIPSLYPLKTCTFQLKGGISFRTNQSNAFLIRINPYFLCQESCYGELMRIDRSYRSGNDTIWNSWFNYSDLSTIQYANFIGDGYQNPKNVPYWDITYDHWIPLSSVRTSDTTALERSNFAKGIQTIPNNIYDQYRLVSASINLRYIGSMDNVSGVIGGSILTQENNELTCVATIEQKANAKPPFNPNSASPETYSGSAIANEYYVFDYFRHSLYHTEHNVLDGLRMLYFPIDNSYNEFTKIYNGDLYTQNIVGRNEYFTIDNKDKFKSSFWWYLYGQGVPFERLEDAGQQNFRLDYCFNFECLPTAEFLNYCPVDTCTYTLNENEKRNIYKEVQKLCIQKLNN